MDGVPVMRPAPLNIVHVMIVPASNERFRSNNYISKCLVFFSVNSITKKESSTKNNQKRIMHSQINNASNQIKIS